MLVGWIFYLLQPPPNKVGHLLTRHRSRKWFGNRCLHGLWRTGEERELPIAIYPTMCRKLRPPNGVTESYCQNTIQVVTTVSGDIHKKVRELTPVTIPILKSFIGIHGMTPQAGSKLL